MKPTKTSIVSAFDGTPSDCTSVTLKLPWLFNGTLSAIEEDLVIEHLMTCKPCQAERLGTEQMGRVLDTHIPTLELAAYAQGLELEASLTDTIRSHLTICASCLEELEFMTDSGSRDTSPRSHRWLRFTAAAVAVVGVGLAAGVIEKAHIEDLETGKKTVNKALAQSSPTQRKASSTSPLFLDDFESGDTASWSDVETFE